MFFDEGDEDAADGGMADMPATEDDEDGKDGEGMNGAI